MKFKLFLFVLLFVITTIKAQGPYVKPNVDWIKYTGSTSNPTLVNIATALDANRRSYSTGFLDDGVTKNLVVIAYDSTGTLLYAPVIYDNGGDDIGNAIVFDAAGNVYCTGESYGSPGTLKDFITIKITPTGSIAWSKRFNNTNGNDIARDLKIDVSGNVYCTGTCYVSPTQLNNVGVVKYDASGNQIWAATNLGGMYDDAAAGLVLSSNSNTLYVAGNLGISAGITDIVVYSIRSNNGTSAWTYTATGTGTGSDESNAIILSGANVVICGLVNNSGTGSDYTTIKINGNSGAQIFKSDYDFSSSVNFATDLCRDSTGNIATVGKALNGSIYEYHVAFYDSVGTRLWVNKESTGSGSGFVKPAIACDTIAHHFYVVGEKLNASNDILVYQVTPTGNTSWRKSIDRVGNFDCGFNLAVNGLGEIYIAALTTNTALGYDITTIKLGQTPDYMAIDNLNERPSEAYAFTENKGQLKDVLGNVVTDIEYYTEYTSPNFYFKGNTMSFCYAKCDTIPSTQDLIQKVNIEFPRSNVYASPFAQEKLEVSKNYFDYTMPGGITEVKESRRLFVPNIYPYIDLHYHSNAVGLKYYFVVKPGGNPANIHHHIVGSSSNTITAGNLQINTLIDTLYFEQPLPYQVMQVGNTYSILPIAWQASWTPVSTDQYGISTGTYNPVLPLIFEIDQGNPGLLSGPPINNLLWNTYVTGNKRDDYLDMDVNQKGDVYALQNTQSNSWFAQPTFTMAFFGFNLNHMQIYKFDQTGIRKKQTIVQSPTGVFGSAIALLSDTNVVVVGYKCDSLFLVAQGLNTFTNSTGSSFILQLVPSMAGLQWWTHYPGLLYDVGVNSNDDIYVLGYGFKMGAEPAFIYPQAGALNLSSITGGTANVITKFQSPYGEPLWSSFLPSWSTAGAPVLKVDKKRNNFYICGNIANSDTTDFVHFNNYNTYLKTSTGGINRKGFIQKFSNSDSLVVSTLYGGNNIDGLSCMEVKKNGDFYIGGSTRSVDSLYNRINPASNEYYKFIVPTNIKARMGWVTQFDSVMHRKWITMYGDSSSATGFQSMATDTAGNLYIAAGTTKFDSCFAFAGFYNQSTTFGGSTYGGTTAFLRFDKHNRRDWVTYMGNNQVNYGAFNFCNSIIYNPTNDNIFFAGGANNVPGNYPFVDFQPGITYYENTAYFNGVDYEAIIGRLGLLPVVVVSLQENEQRKSESTISVYPNPSTCEVTVLKQFDLSKPYTLKVFNTVGALVYSEVVKDYWKQAHTISLAHLTNGIYFVNMASEELNKTAKLIKE